MQRECGENAARECGGNVERMWRECGENVERMWRECGENVEIMWRECGENVRFDNITGQHYTISQIFKDTSYYKYYPFDVHS